MNAFDPKYESQLDNDGEVTGSPVALRDACEFFLDCISGLDRPQKTLSCKWLYDDTGSTLFEAICATPEYYLARAETALLAEALPDLAARLDKPTALIEFGSGASRKTRLFLDAALTVRTYVPIDISAHELARSSRAIERDYASIEVEPVCADFTGPLRLGAEIMALERIGFFPGSTLGNFDTAAAAAFLASAGELFGHGGRLLLGVDLRKDERTLLAAYDDAAGVTAAFNRNVLTRINRELGADIDVGAFEHRATWNAAESRIEMHLVSRREQRFRIGHRRFTLAAGETIHTENSRKFTLAGLEALTAEAGWRVEDRWLSGDPAYALVLLSDFSAPPADAPVAEYIEEFA